MNINRKIRLAAVAVTIIGASLGFLPANPAVAGTCAHTQVNWCLPYAYCVDPERTVGTSIRRSKVSKGNILARLS
jgi:hypothetical protein